MTAPYSARERPLVAIAGCGAVTRLYYRPALEKLESEGVLHVAGAFDPDSAAARDFCSAFSAAKIADSFESLIAGPLDILIVASPPSFHAAQTIAALRAGIGVHCEKPLARTLADGEQMIAAAEAAGRPLTVGMIRRHLPAARMIRGMITSGAIGSPRSIDIFEGGPFDWPVHGPGYFDRRAGGAGVLEDIGTHSLDLLRWWLGEPDSIAYRDDTMGGVEANCRIDLGFGDCRASIRLSRDWHRPNRYLVRGDAGWLRWTVNDADVLEYGCKGDHSGARLSLHGIERSHDELRLDRPAGDFHDAFTAQIKGVIEALQGNSGESVSATDAIGTLRLVERCKAIREAMDMRWMSAPPPSPSSNAKPRVAILGAGGFIGNRSVEMLHMGGRHEIVPVVRRASALSLPCRFEIAPRIADANDVEALEAAFSGCDAVVAAIAGDPKTIVDTVTPLYHAAQRAGVRRLVYLSTASVHGQSPAPGTDEITPLSTRQPLAYNRAKVRAEQRLLDLRRRGSVELVILRPGIVHGPRSQWIGGFADQLLAGEAYLVDGGNGICNSIYVDNVVHAIERAIDAKGIDGEAFLIGDAETVSWRQMLSPIADALGIDIDTLPQPSSSSILQSREPMLRTMLFPPARYAFRKLPRRLAHALRAARRAAREHRGAPAEPSRPPYSREMALLHSCAVRLPCTKAERLLEYRPPVTFEEGCRRSLAWLAFAGYPVRP